VKLEGARTYNLWFGTNRKPVSVGGAEPRFSAERADQLYHGICQVTLPASHRFGSVGTTGIRGWLGRLVGKADDRLTLDSVEVLEEAAFWGTLKGSLLQLKPDERSAVVYIHGYNVSFESAALRAAQMGADLNVPGAMAFYSWPSQGTEAGYTDDEASIEGSEKYIAEFLTQMATSSGVTRIDVIAHSMGNRGLLRALQRMLSKAETRSSFKFGQVILAAPDVDADVFRDLAAVYPQISARTSLYISRKDRALWLSKFFHGYHRAGYMPPTMVVPNIDTIEVSDIDLTLLGHGYYGAAEAVLYDMHELIWSGRPPGQRARLKPAKAASGDAYWVVRG